MEVLNVNTVFLTPEFSSSQLANAEAKLILAEDIVHCSPALR